MCKFSCAFHVLTNSFSTRLLFATIAFCIKSYKLLLKYRIYNCDREFTNEPEASCNNEWKTAQKQQICCHCLKETEESMKRPLHDLCWCNLSNKISWLKLEWSSIKCRPTKSGRALNIYYEILKYKIITMYKINIPTCMLI